MEKSKIEILLEQAQKIIDLSMQMNEIFDNIYTVEHHKLAICAGLLDAYNQGYKQGYDDGFKSPRT